MRELVFFLEERSAAAMLEGLLPKLLPDDVVPRYITFEGKQDLEGQLVRRRGLGITGIAAQQATRKFREPDRLNSAKEELRRLTNHRYQPVEGSRAIGPCLDPENGRSRSFRNLVAGIRRLVGGHAEGNTEA